MVTLAGCGRLGFGDLGDAGGGDAGGGDVAVFPLGEACPTFAIFCDGFETGDVSAWTGNILTPGATLSADNDIVHTGRFALAADVPAISSGAFAALDESYSSTSTGMLAIRAWIYAPSSFGEFSGPLILTDVGNVHQVLLSGDLSMLWTVSEGGVDHHSTMSVVGATWSCVELDYTFGTPATIDLYLDDANIESVSAVDGGADFDEVIVGVARASAAGEDAVVDDVVIALQHIGC